MLNFFSLMRIKEDHPVVISLMFESLASKCQIIQNILLPFLTLVTSELQNAITIVIMMEVYSHRQND